MAPFLFTEALLKQPRMQAIKDKQTHYCAVTLVWKHLRKDKFFRYHHAGGPAIKFLTQAMLDAHLHQLKIVNKGAKEPKGQQQGKGKKKRARSPAAAEGQDGTKRQRCTRNKHVTQSHWQIQQQQDNQQQQSHPPQQQYQHQQQEQPDFLHQHQQRQQYSHDYQQQQQQRQGGQRVLGGTQQVLLWTAQPSHQAPGTTGGRLGATGAQQQGAAIHGAAPHPLDTLYELKVDEQFRTSYAVYVKREEGGGAKGDQRQQQVQGAAAVSCGGGTSGGQADVALASLLELMPSR